MSYEPPRPDPRVVQPSRYEDLYPAESEQEEQSQDAVEEPVAAPAAPPSDQTEEPRFNGLTPPPGYQLTYGRSKRKGPLYLGLAVCLVVGILITSFMLMPALGLSNGLVGAWFNNSGGSIDDDLEAAVPLLPIHRSELRGDSTILYWAPVQSADNYTLIIACSMAVTLNITTADNQYELAALANGATYHWSVAAVKAGHYGPPSEVFAFTVWNEISSPTLTSPLNGSVVINELSSLKWSPVEGADEYRIQMAADASFSKLFIDVTTPTTSYQPNVWMPHNTHCYWRVMAVHSTLMSDWSVPRCFSYSIVVSIPAPLSPSSSVTVLGTSTNLTWSPVDGATAYRVQVSKSSSFDNLIVDVTTLDEQYEIRGNLLQDTTYYWRVQAGQDGAWSQWCTSRNFYVGFDSFTFSYSWSYKGKTWTLTETISGSSYYEYRDRVRTYNYASYVTDEDPLVVAIATELKQVASSQGYNYASFILSFVQSLPYTNDIDTTGFVEYPRYCVETLVDRGGDCEDTSILFASLIQSSPINYDAVLLKLTKTGSTGHMAVGLWATGVTGTYYTYMGRDYYYCETTGAGWTIGELPPDMRGYSCVVLPC